jgi:hypothetical protein
MILPLDLVRDAFEPHLRNWDIQRFDEDGYITIRAQRRVLVPGAMNIHYEMLRMAQCPNEEYVRQKFTLIERRLAAPASL